MTIRSLPPLLTLTTLALVACSPVVLPPDTETDTDTANATEDGSGGETAEETGAEETGEAEGGVLPGDVPTACVDLEPRVLGVLEANCAKCHGPGSAAQGGIDYILDLDSLIATEKVIPKDPENSRIYARMTAAENPMPPLSEMQRPTPGDIESVKKWIAECAGVQSCGEQAFITRDAMLKAINADIASEVAVANRQFTRYITFVHLHNAGWCEAEIEPFRQALFKLVNSLSQETAIHKPVAIDGDRLIYRIDITDFDWDADVINGQRETFRLSEPSFHFRDDNLGSVNQAEQLELEKRFADKWEMIADQNPYAIEYIGESAEDIKRLAVTKFPILQGDAFIDVTSRSPLYYDILGIPKRSADLKGDPNNPVCGSINDDNPENDCLEDLLGIDVLGNFEDEKVNDDDVLARAGFKESDVSDFNRVIERHEFESASNRAFWISYDFAGQSGRKNISEHPLDFEFDGGEIIFNLPNGMQAYMLTDDEGRRLNEGPIGIVQDESQKDFLVRNGVSCMGCHSSGMIKASDDIRYDLDEGQTETVFDQDTKDQIRRIYPTRVDFDSLLEIDIGVFTNALRTAGVDVGGPKEPVMTTFLAFDENLGLRRAGAEFSLPEEVFAGELGRLSVDLRELGKDGGNVQRPDFTAVYAESVCALNIGCTRECPGLLVDKDPQDPQDPQGKISRCDLNNNGVADD